MTLMASQIPQVPEVGSDGLMVSFRLRCNLDQIHRPLKLLSFTTTDESNSFLDILYDSGTLTFRRKMSPGSKYYYDYNLFDPMFQRTGDELTWEIRVFFTSYFFWVETRDTRILLGRHYHAPIFFGVDLPGQNFMSDYLNRMRTGKWIFGDPDGSQPFTMPSEIEIYDFNYSQLKDELQSHFCEEAPVPATTRSASAEKILTSGLSEQKMDSKISYSQQTKLLTVDFPNVVREQIKLNVFDASGRIVWNMTLPPTINIHQQISLNLPSGLYFVRTKATREENQIISKFIIQ
jgi:hypothetical protein